jgi:hypothetical protein
MTKNNFDLGTRDLVKAGKFALGHFCNRRGISIATVASDASRWSRFALFARSKGVKWMEDVTGELVVDYGNELADLALNESLSASYAQNLLSAVNSIMSLATVGRWQSVSPIGCGIPERIHLRLEAPTGMERAKIEEAAAALRDAGLLRAEIVAQLTREFGLRLKEASMLDAKRALEQALTRNKVEVDKGTKGGRKRSVPVCWPSQIDALKRAAELQGNHRSLIPSDQTWAQFRDGEIRAAREILKAYGIEKFHDLRAAYACERYKELAGLDAPVFNGTRAECDADKAARLIVANELGHGRIDVTNAYLGGRRK